MVSGRFIRRRRERVDLTLEVLSILSKVSLSTIAGWERGLRSPSQEHEDAVLATLDKLEAVRARFDGIPLRMTDFRWLKKQIAALNEGIQAGANAEHRASL